MLDAGLKAQLTTYLQNLRQPITLVASLDAQRSLASPMDGVLQVVSDRGFVLAQNNDYAGLDPQVTFRVPTDGRYVVRVFAFPATPDASVRFGGGDRFLYRLTLTTSPNRPSWTRTTCPPWRTRAPRPTPTTCTSPRPPTPT